MLLLLLLQLLVVEDARRVDLRDELLVAGEVAARVLDALEDFLPARELFVLAPAQFEEVVRVDGRSVGTFFDLRSWLGWVIIHYCI